MHGITYEPGDRKKLISPGRLDACPAPKRDSDVTLQLNHRKVLEGHLVVFLVTGNETNISIYIIYTMFFT